MITFAYVPPPIILGFAKHPIVDKYDLSSLKWLNSGAAPLTKELVDGVWERLTIPTKQGYGLSETSPVSHMQSVLEWAKYKGSVGGLMPNMEAKIVDLEGNEVPQGEVSPHSHRISAIWLGSRADGRPHRRVRYGSKARTYSRAI